ncbi:prepilin-type N-terminal cleavage/methylation domain-containing protein [Pseudomonas sp. F1_0610]|uniref:pilus assembly FimT family protein n=1 Tax=Pseudomonas sp. F1_0610 TaxID=3114284 RepID=UPI0039C1BE2C
MKNRGFTLIEVMIVVVLIGIIAAIAIPNLNPFISKNKAEAMADNIENLIRKTRNTAIVQGRTASIDIIGREWVSKDYNNTIIAKVEILDGVNIKPVNFENKIRFDKQGFILNNRGVIESRSISIHICSGEIGKKLQLKTTTSITVEDSNATICN